MASFYPLTVTAIHRETRDSIAVTLQPRDEDRGAFDFIQGQFLTFRQNFEGEELRRCYSICTAPKDQRLQIAIKRVEGGAFSNWANDNLAVGDYLEVMPPQGLFHSPINPAQSKRYLGFAGGSGITPLLSIIKTVLQEEPGSTFTLVYGNRATHQIMFREALEDMKNRYLGRFSLLHILESEAPEIELFAGRVDRVKCESLLQHWIDIARIDQVFICGPEPMMDAVNGALQAHGMDSDKIKIERFSGIQIGRARQPYGQSNGQSAGEGKTCKVAILLEGTRREIEFAVPGPSLLEAALAADMDAPHACKAGVCSTCRALVLEGEVAMESNNALEDYEVRRGYVLTCQSYPLTDKVVIDYDG